MAYSNNYLSRDESTAIKGLLIFLIILGHNAVLTQSVKSIMPFLYLFHVKLFFIIPFLYKVKTNTFKVSLEKNFIRLYYPYLIFFIFLSILYYFTSKVINDPHQIAKNLLSIQDNEILFFFNTILTGNPYLIDYFTGYQFLWFLPVMFSLNIVKNQLQDNKTARAIILALGFIFYIVFYSITLTPELTKIQFCTMLFSPFAIAQAVAMYFLGYVCSKILLNTKYNKVINIVGTILFVALSVFLVYNLSINHHFIKESSLGAIYRFAMPFLAMGIVYTFKEKISKVRVFRALGEVSLPLYIFSTLICTVFYLIFKKIDAITPLNGIIAQVLIMLVSYYFVKLFYKLPFIYNKIFPQTLDCIKVKFSRKAE